MNTNEKKVVGNETGTGSVVETTDVESVGKSTTKTTVVPEVPEGVSDGQVGDGSVKVPGGVVNTVKTALCLLFILGYLTMTATSTGLADDTALGAQDTLLNGTLTDTTLFATAQETTGRTSLTTQLCNLNELTSDPLHTADTTTALCTLRATCS